MSIAMMSSLSKLFLPAVLLLLCFVSGHATDASSTAAAGSFASSLDNVPQQCQLTTERCVEGTFYATDIEGDGMYWKAVKASMVKGCEGPACVKLKEGYCFVYGGDTGDKGDFSMRVIRWLVELKQNNQESVCLIPGNRDYNKLRLAQELGAEAMQVAAEDTCVGILSGDLNIDEKLCANCHKSSTDHTIIVPCCCKPFTGNPKTRIRRLDGILTKTMGSGGDHLRRKKELAELAELAKVKGEEGEFWKSFIAKIDEACKDVEAVGIVSETEQAVTDKEPWAEGEKCRVVESYILMASAGLEMGRSTYRSADRALGLYAEYLRYAQVVAFYPTEGDGEKGALFVHGMLDGAGMYKVPPLKLDEEQKPTEITEKNLKNWATKLFDWNQEIMEQFTDGTQNERCKEEDWKEPAVPDGEDAVSKTFGCMTQRPGWPAIEWACLAHLEAIRPVSTIIAGRSRSKPEEGNILKDLCEFEKNLVAVFVGHTPSGITPDVRGSDNGCVTLNGDTSVLNGPKAGDGNHHGCGTPPPVTPGTTPETDPYMHCENFFSIVIKPAGDAAFDIQVTGKVNRELANFMPLLDPHSKVSGTINENNPKDPTTSKYKRVTVGKRLFEAEQPLFVELTLTVPQEVPASSCTWGDGEPGNGCVPTEETREMLCKRPTETKNVCFGEEATEGGKFMARLPLKGDGLLFLCTLSPLTWKGFNIFVDGVGSSTYTYGTDKPYTIDGKRCPWKLADKLLLDPARFAGLNANKHALRLRRVVTSTSATSTSTSSTEAHIEQELNELYGYPGAVGWLGDGIES